MFLLIYKNLRKSNYYCVQYCYARIHSIVRLSKQDINSKKIIKGNKNKINKFEREIIRKIFEWPKIVKYHHQINMSRIVYHFTFMNFQHYFTLIE